VAALNLVVTCSSNMSVKAMILATHIHLIVLHRPLDVRVILLNHLLRRISIPMLLPDMQETLCLLLEVLKLVDLGLLLRKIVLSRFLLLLLPMKILFIFLSLNFVFFHLMFLVLVQLVLKHFNPLESFDLLLAVFL
jgi:hypothetical protein